MFECRRLKVCEEGGGGGGGKCEGREKRLLMIVVRCIEYGYGMDMETKRWGRNLSR
jgi:hypothetical protein